LLARANAQAILTGLEDGRVSAISFRIAMEFGPLTFRLPARVAWRIVKDWPEAQLAVIRAGLVDLEQVFLPYAQDAHGNTLYERMRSQRFSGLRLEDGPKPGA
jgi:hypothetical protein